LPGAANQSGATQTSWLVSSVYSDNHSDDDDDDDDYDNDKDDDDDRDHYFAPLSPVALSSCNQPTAFVLI